jgi:hypothetical protein
MLQWRRETRADARHDALVIAVDGWHVVDDDDYGQAVGNPKRKV